MAAFVSGSSAALAGDWTANKLRGTVWVSQGSQWIPLNRGDAVPQGQTVRTMGNGFVEFGRGDETITLKPNTQVQIRDWRGGSYTTVGQFFGTVQVADDHTAQPHFEVDTPYVAAVVKGTVFTVTSGRHNSRVDVHGGAVQVYEVETKSSVTIGPQQHASAGASQPLAAGGPGTIAPIVPRGGSFMHQSASTSRVDSHPPGLVSSSQSDHSSSGGGSGNAGIGGNPSSSSAGGSASNSPSGPTSSDSTSQTSSAGGSSLTSSGSAGGGSHDNSGSDNGRGNGGTPGNGGQNGGHHDHDHDH